MKKNNVKKLIKLIRLDIDFTNRNFGLDLMRFFAIIFVVQNHASMLEKANTNFPYIRLIDGVELFFVLSGFLIGRILIKLYLDTEKFNFKDVLIFWKRRWFRTLPNYYLILILNIVIVYFGIIKEDFTQFNWKFLFFLQNFNEPFYGFYWESWSLSIEEWFYLFFPLILLAISIFPSNLISKKIKFFTAILILIIIPSLLRIFVASKFEVDDFWFGVKIAKVVIFRIDSIAWGILAAFIYKYSYDFWVKSKNLFFVLGLTILYSSLYHHWPANDFITKTIKFNITSIGCVLLLPKFESLKTSRIKLKYIVTHISLISYSMYLINLALVSEVIYFNFLPTTALISWITFLIYWMVVIIFSTFLFKYFENPIMKLRDRQ